MPIYADKGGVGQKYLDSCFRNIWMGPYFIPKSTRMIYFAYDMTINMLLENENIRNRLKASVLCRRLTQAGTNKRY